MKASRVPVPVRFLPHIDKRPRLVTSSARGRGHSSSNDVTTRGQRLVNRSLTSPLEIISKDREPATTLATTKIGDNQSVSQLQKDLHNARFQCDMLRYELKGREIEFGEEMEILRHQLNQSRDECATLRDNMGESEKVKDEIGNDLEVARQQVMQMEEQLAVSRSDVNSLQGELDIATRQINGLQNELDLNKKQIDSLQRELDSTNQQLHSAQEELRVAKNCINTLRSEVDSTSEQVSALQAQLLQSEHQRELLVEPSHVLTLDNQRLKATVDRIEELEGELTQCKALLASKETIIGDRENEYCSEVKRLKDIIANYEEQNVLLVTHVASADKKRETAVNDRSKITNSNNYLKRRYSKLEEELSRIQSENETLKKKLKEHEKRETLKNKQIKELTTTKEKFVQEAAKIKQATEELGHVLTEKQAMIEKLQRDVINMHSSIIPLTSPRLGPGIALALNVHSDVIDASSLDETTNQSMRKFQPALVLTNPDLYSTGIGPENYVTKQMQKGFKAVVSTGDNVEHHQRVNDTRQLDAVSLQQRLDAANSRIHQLEAYMDKIYNNAVFKKLNLK